MLEVGRSTFDFLFEVSYEEKKSTLWVTVYHKIAKNQVLTLETFFCSQKITYINAPALFFGFARLCYELAVNKP